MTAALEAALGQMELEPADQVLVDGAKALALKIDTIDDENLLLRYHAHYSRYLRDLVKRSDANRARRLADEAQAKAAAAAANPADNALNRLRARRGDAEREKWEQAQARKIRRMQASGMTIPQIAEKMKWQQQAVRAQLAAYPHLRGA
jgi:hypothetical protein